MNQSDFVQLVLEELGVLALGQAVQPEDSARVLRRLDPVFADLAAREIYSVATSDDIEDAAALYLATCVAVSCAPIYGKRTIRDKALDDARTSAEELLETLARPLPTNQTLICEPFWGRRPWRW